MSKYYTTITSPIGDLVVTSNGQAITGVYPPGNTHYLKAKQGKFDDSLFNNIKNELNEYFQGKRSDFSFPIALSGTDFQQKVWQQLRRIKPATTITYQELASKVGKPKASRAVGNANAANPLCLIIPCHRVIHASGKLGGYNGDIAIKPWLLEHERKYFSK